MLNSILLAGLHYMGLGIGLGSLFSRGRMLHRLRKNPSEPKLLKAVFFSDNFYGLAAILWLSTGLLRLLGGYEKPANWYFHNTWFQVKMALFISVALLELWPMVKLIQWRIGHFGRKPPHFTFFQLKLMGILNDIELVILCMIPFLAAAMTRAL